MNKKILITGAAGFIGYHLTQRFCQSGFQVVGIDTLNDYYDVQLKLDRLHQLKGQPNFLFIPVSITDKDSLDELFARHQFEYVINLAAQAGVRYSIDKPYKYIDANLIGFINILEACRQYRVKHLLFASSSSVYGANTKIPFSESDHADHPVSLYAATKKANEMMAHSYASLYNIPCTGLRFFTVYGPWGRPDMAYFKFTKAIFENQPIEVYNNGELWRDFTYIDDIVEGIANLLDIIPQKTTAASPPPNCSTTGPYAIYNIGNNQPVKLMAFIKTLEETIGLPANKSFKPMQPGDVFETYANIDALQQATGFQPTTSIQLGLTHFVQWYRDYYRT